jgi:hypothetical protein
MSNRWMDGGERMSGNRVYLRLTVLVFVLGLLGVFTAVKPVHAAGTCGSGVTQPVVFLTRSGLEQPFARLKADPVAPFLDVATNQTMVSVRSLVSSFANNAMTEWDQQSRTAHFAQGSNLLSIHFPTGTISTSVAQVNGQSYYMNAFICNGTIIAPARSITDAFRVGLKWYADQTVVADPTWPYVGTEVVARPVYTYNARIAEGAGTGRLFKACDTEPQETGLWAPVRRAARSVACYLLRGD